MYNKRQRTANGEKFHPKSDKATTSPSIEAATQADLKTHTNTSIIASEGTVNKITHPVRRKTPNFTRVPVDPEFGAMYQTVCMPGPQELPTGTDTILEMSGHDAYGDSIHSQDVVDSKHPSQNLRPGQDHYNRHGSNHGGASSAAGSYQRLAVEAPHTDLQNYQSYTGIRPANAFCCQPSAPSIVVNGGRGNDPLYRSGDPESQRVLYAGSSLEASGRNSLSACHSGASTPGPYGTGSTHSHGPWEHKFTSQDLSMSEPETRSLAQEPWN